MEEEEELMISTGPSQPLQFCDSGKLTLGQSWKEFVPPAALHEMEDRDKQVQALDSKQGQLEQLAVSAPRMVSMQLQGCRVAAR